MFPIQTNLVIVLLIIFNFVGVRPLPGICFKIIWREHLASWVSTITSNCIVHITLSSLFFTVLSYDGSEQLWRTELSVSVLLHHHQYVYTLSMSHHFWVNHIVICISPSHYSLHWLCIIILVVPLRLFSITAHFLDRLNWWGVATVSLSSSPVQFLY